MFIRYFFISAISSWFILLSLNQLDFVRWHIFDPEFGIWSAKENLIQKVSGKDVVLILGDSRTSTAFHPLENSKVLNLSIGGATPVEAYFILNRLISNNTHIEKLIISFVPIHFEFSENFLGRAILFNFYLPNEFDDLLNQSSNQALFGNDLISIYSCRYKTPNCYMPYYKTLLTSGYSTKNIAIYQETVSQNGWHLYGENGWNPAAKINKPTEFQNMKRRFIPDSLINNYFDRLLVLAKENKIPITYYILPIEQKSYEAILKEVYINQYFEYIKSKDIDIIYGGGMKIEYVGDGNHYNKAGSDIITKDINKNIINR